MQRRLTNVRSGLLAVLLPLLLDISLFAPVAPVMSETASTHTSILWTRQLSDWVWPTPLVYYNTSEPLAACADLPKLGIFVGRQDGAIDGMRLSQCDIPTTVESSPANPTFSSWTITTNDDVKAPGAISPPQLVNLSDPNGGYDEIVAIGSQDGKMYGLFASSGLIAWTHDTTRFITGGALYYPAENTFIFGGTSTFTIYALNARTGAVRWQYANPNGGRYEATPLIVTTSDVASSIDFGRSGMDMLVLGSIDGRVYFVNAADGGNAVSVNLGCAIRTDPILSPRKDALVFGCARKVMLVSLLRMSSGIFDFKEVLSTSAFVVATPAVVGDMIVVAGNDGIVRGLMPTSATTATVEWEAAILGSTNGPVVPLPDSYDAVVMTRTTGTVYVIRPSTGYVLGIWEPPALAAGHRFTGGPATYGCGCTQCSIPCTVVVVTERGAFYGIDYNKLTDGTTAGDFFVQSNTSKGISGAVIGGVVAGCLVVILCIIGGIYSAVRHAKQQEEREQIAQEGRRQAALQRDGQTDGDPYTAAFQTAVLNVPNDQAVVEPERRQRVTPPPAYHERQQQPPAYPMEAPGPRDQGRRRAGDGRRENNGIEYEMQQPQPVEPRRAPRSPVIVGDDDAAGGGDTMLEVQLYSANQALSNAVLNATEGTGSPFNTNGGGGGASGNAELPWWYIERLTKNFSEPLPVWHSQHSVATGVGAGGSGGTLYLGSDFIEGVLTRVVVKVFLPGEGNEGAVGAAALPHEMKIASHLRHPNIIPIYAFSQNKPGGTATTTATASNNKPLGSYATVMKYVPGGSLAGILSDPMRSSRLGALSRLHIALGVAYGLKEMHNRGLYHRDVKSNNVLVDPSQGEGILIDFDVSCETGSGAGGPVQMQMTARRRVFGTPGYICPDYARLVCGYGEPQEVYSFCVVLAELLTGRLSSPPETDFANPEETLRPFALTSNPKAPEALSGSSFTPLVAGELQDMIRAGLQSNHKKRPALGRMIKLLKQAIVMLRHPEELDAAGGELGSKQWSSISVEDIGAAPRPNILAGRRDEGADSLLVCCICAMEAGEFGVKKGVECSANDRHFLCDECMNNRVATILDSGEPIDLMSLPCSLPGCRGRVFLSSFANLLHPKTFRRWHEATAKAARKQGQEEAQEQFNEILNRQGGGGSGGGANAAQMKDFQKHVQAVRKLLQPACPHCGLMFTSFSGCLAVTCGVRGVQGCNKKFCGACLVPYPCPARHGHGAMTHEQLHNSWKVWRRQKVIAYLDKKVGPAGSMLRTSVCESMRVELEACGIYPLVPNAADDLL